jgi:putative transposase
MCEVLEVSKAGYYRWLNRKPSVRGQYNQGLLAYLKQVAQCQHGIPGYRKLWQEAVAEGYICSQNRVQRLLQAEGYRSCTAPKPGHRKPAPGMPVLPNLLNRQFTVTEANRVWVSDITQVRCQEGWLYLAVVLDLYSRRVVGWAAGAQNTSDLVERAIQHAWREREPARDSLLFHSDQGSQYCSEAVMTLLNEKGVTISMSRRGNCWDNACAESFFAQLKKEWLHRLDILTREDMGTEIRYYIEHYYNTVRRHGTIGSVAPATFEKAA